MRAWYKSNQFPNAVACKDSALHAWHNVRESHLFAAQIFMKKCKTEHGPELDAQASVFDETYARLKEMTRSIFFEGRSCFWGVGEVSF